MKIAGMKGPEEDAVPCTLPGKYNKDRMLCGRFEEVEGGET